MGAKVAPTFATLFMGYLEESLYDRLKQEHGTEVAEYVRKNWKRFWMIVSSHGILIYI